MSDGQNGERLRLQEDPEVLAYQFLNVVEGQNGEIKFGGNAFVRDGLTWNQVFEGVGSRIITQFVNGKVIVWRKAKATAKVEAPGFKRS